MAIFDLFSKRQKKLRGEVPDVYQYDTMSNSLRVQIVHIITDAIGEDKEKYSYPNRPADAYKFIHETVCRNMVYSP